MVRKNSYTILVLTDKGTRARQFFASRLFISLFTVFFIAFLLISGIFVVDYLRLRSATIRSGHLEKVVQCQKEDIGHQKQQIEIFARRINRIKSQLAELIAFEEKIKVVANLEEADNPEAVLGVGGSLPEDMDTRKVVESGHLSLLREMHRQMDQLERVSEGRQESFEYLLDRLKDRENLLASTPSIRPTSGWYSSRFGHRKSPFTGKKEFHKGLDIATRKGTEILATADGIISFTGRNGLLGKTITIDHGHGMATRYAHVDKILKKKGERVQRGDVIGHVGNTGRSTGSHLHYEVMLNGIQVNPEKYIQD